MSLPEGWVETTLGDLAEYLNGAAFKPLDWGEEGTPIIRIQNLTDPSKPFNRTKRIVDNKLRIDAGDILVSWSATLDAFIWNRESGWLNQHIFKVIPNKYVDKGFIFYLLKIAISDLVRGEYLHGSTMKHINRGPFLAHQVPLPPLSEQKRIADKLDQVLARVTSAQAHLDTIPGLLKRTRQAILSAAFTKYIDSQRLDEIAEVSGGLTKNSKRNELPLQMPYLRVANVYANRLDLTEIKEIGVNESEITRTLLKQDDLLFVEGNGSIDQIGRVAVWDGSIENCLHQNHLIKARFSNPISSKFALYYFLSEPGREQIIERASTTTGLHTLSISKISSLLLPFPTIKEQAETIKQVEALFERLDRIEAATQTAKAKVDAITQSTLAKAFRGQLVPQDPTDEPASVLLERIKSERAKQTNPLQKSSPRKKKELVEIT